MGGVWLVLFGILLHSALQGVKGAWQMAALSGGILVFVLGWVATFRICISGNILSYRSLFGGTRTIQLGEIESAEIKIGMKEKFGPFYKLILWPEASIGRRPIVINMKVSAGTT
jgi:hypothetical protein